MNINKRLKISIVLFSIFLLCACTQVKNKYGFNEYSSEEIIDKLSSSSSFLLTISASDCYSCEQFMEETKEVLVNNKIEMCLLSYDDLNDDTMNQLKLLLGSYSSFPITYNIINGRNAGQYEYSKDAEGFNEWLVKQNIIQK